MFNTLVLSITVSTSVFETVYIGSIPIGRLNEYHIVVIISDFHSDDSGSNPDTHKIKILEKL